jgi:hypothetical protein
MATVRTCRLDSLTNSRLVNLFACPRTLNGPASPIALTSPISYTFPTLGKFSELLVKPWARRENLQVTRSAFLRTFQFD